MLMGKEEHPRSYSVNYQMHQTDDRFNLLHRTPAHSGVCQVFASSFVPAFLWGFGVLACIPHAERIRFVQVADCSGMICM